MIEQSKGGPDLGKTSFSISKRLALWNGKDLKEFEKGPIDDGQEMR